MRRFALLLSAVAGLTAAYPAGAQQMGINLSGCEFDNQGTLCPDAADIAWYSDQGFHYIRIPARSVMLQPTPMGALDADGLAKIRTVVARIKAAGGVPVLDLRHDFRHAKPEVLVDFWTKVVRGLDNDAAPLLELENEPQGWSSTETANDFEQAVVDGNKVIRGLRAAGVYNTILMAWPQYQASFRFDKKETSRSACNSLACALDRKGGLIDPLRKTVIAVHGYFDRGSSGTQPKCDGILNLNKARESAERRGLRLFLSESAFGSWQGVPVSCQAVGRAAVAEIREHPETWMGVTWWGGGRAWKEKYLFKVEPTKGTRARVAASSYLKLISGR